MDAGGVIQEKEETEGAGAPPESAAVPADMTVRVELPADAVTDSAAPELGGSEATAPAGFFGPADIPVGLVTSAAPLPASAPAATPAPAPPPPPTPTPGPAPEPQPKTASAPVVAPAPAPPAASSSAPVAAVTAPAPAPLQAQAQAQAQASSMATEAAAATAKPSVVAPTPAPAAALVSAPAPSTSAAASTPASPPTDEAAPAPADGHVSVQTVDVRKLPPPGATSPRSSSSSGIDASVATVMVEVGDEAITSAPVGGDGRPAALPAAAAPHVEEGTQGEQAPISMAVAPLAAEVEAEAADGKDDAPEATAKEAAEVAEPPAAAETAEPAAAAAADATTAMAKGAPAAAAAPALDPSNVGVRARPKRVVRRPQRSSFGDSSGMMSKADREELAADRRRTKLLLGSRVTVQSINQSGDCYYEALAIAFETAGSPVAQLLPPHPEARAGECDDQLLLDGQIRVRVEIMGPVKYDNVGKSQSVNIMSNPIIFTRTRKTVAWCGEWSDV
jgi:hypothetical protein